MILAIIFEFLEFKDPNFMCKLCGHIGPSWPPGGRNEHTRHIMPYRLYQLCQIKMAMFRCPPDETKRSGVKSRPLS